MKKKKSISKPKIFLNEEELTDLKQFIKDMEKGKEDIDFIETGGFRVQKEVVDKELTLYEIYKQIGYVEVRKKPSNKHFKNAKR